MKKIICFVISIGIAVGCLVGGIIATAQTDETVSMGIAARSLSFAESVIINFKVYYDGIDTDKDEFGVIFWREDLPVEECTYQNAVNGNATISNEVNSWEYKANIDKNVAVFCYSVFGHEMNDMIYAQPYAVKNGEYYYGAKEEYSVVTYAGRKLGLIDGGVESTNENLKNLLRNMLDYGASVQIYGNYRTDALANDILIERYTVTFKDWDGTVLKTERVKSGEDATAPSNPTRVGYTFDGWDEIYEAVTSDTVVTAKYVSNSTEPTISVSNVTADAGDTVSVNILVKNNPGIAGAKIKISYDSALTLTDSSSGEVLSGLQYTKPGKYVSPCNFTWDSESGCASADGVILTLTFKVDGFVSSGDKLAVNCAYTEGDIYDENLDNLTFETVNGTVTIN